MLTVCLTVGHSQKHLENAELGQQKFHQGAKRCFKIDKSSYSSNFRAIAHESLWIFHVCILPIFLSLLPVISRLRGLPFIPLSGSCLLFWSTIAEICLLSFLWTSRSVTWPSLPWLMNPPPSPPQPDHLSETALRFSNFVYGESYPNSSLALVLLPSRLTFSNVNLIFYKTWSFECATCIPLLCLSLFLSFFFFFKLFGHTLWQVGSHTPCIQSIEFSPPGAREVPITTPLIGVWGLFLP